MKKINIAIALVVGGFTTNVSAADFTDMFTFSGFGTASLVTTDTDDGQYIREQQNSGATRTPSIEVDSNIGFQLTANFTDSWSATVQTRTAQRFADDFSTRIEWAFIRGQITDKLVARAGKFNLANFMVSDYRSIGYANNWVRPANEVYGLDLLNDGLTGGDLTYRLPVGRNSIVINGLMGESRYTGRDYSQVIDVEDLVGLNLTWDGDWYSFRVGHIEASPQLDAGLAAFLPPGEELDETYKFSGVGANIEYEDIYFQAEYVKRRSTQFGNFIAANAWYVMLGYQVGDFLPFITIADLENYDDSVVAPQETQAIGVRWDAFDTAALKFQVERVDTLGTNGISFLTPVTVGPFGPVSDPITDPVHTFTVSLDFIF